MKYVFAFFVMSALYSVTASANKSSWQKMIVQELKQGQQVTQIKKQNGKLVCDTELMKGYPAHRDPFQTVQWKNAKSNPLSQSLNCRSKTLVFESPKSKPHVLCAEAQPVISWLNDLAQVCGR